MKLFKRWGRRIPGIGKIWREREELRAQIRSLALEACELSDRYNTLLAESRLQSLPESRKLDPGKSRRILHLNYRDHGGGAAMIANSLHHGLSDRVASSVLVARKTTDREDVVSLETDFPVLSPILGEFAPYSPSPGFSSLSSSDLSHHPEVLRADVVHLHNLHPNYFNFTNLPPLSRSRRLLWTLHDEFALTGHCAFTLECEGWLSGCSTCPFPERYPPAPSESTGTLFERKRELYQRSELLLICPSEWMASQVGKSMLADQPHRVIPNGVSTNVFYPGDKAAARQSLGIPEDAFVCLFAADGGIQNPFKGGEIVSQLIPQFSSYNGLLFLEVGGKKEESSQLLSLGRFESHDAMADCYRASDLFLYPTRADSFGLVVAEAMACGLPVIASRVGAIPELVVDGETGWLAPSVDASRFAECIESAISDRRRLQEMGSAGAERIRQKFSLRKMVDSYREVYEMSDQEWKALFD